MKKFLAVCLAAVLLLSSVPTSFAAQPGDVKYTVTTHKTTTVAPGVTQDDYTAVMDSGSQVRYYLATVDLTRDDLAIYANYKDNQYNGWGLQTTSGQMAAAQARHSDPSDEANYIPYYQVVAGVNAGYYNMSTGQPTGAFAMEGHIVQGANNRPFFAVRADGTYVIGANTSEWNAYNAESPIVEAVDGSVVLIKNGVIQQAPNSDYNNNPNARAILGIKKDENGRATKIVLGAVDGNMAPISAGMNMAQLAQVLYDQGCTDAINLDGGGSSTLITRQEDGQFKMINTPVDGYERSVSTSLMVVSTTPPSDAFASVELTPEHNYVTPGSTVNIEARGYSPAHTEVDIPEDAVWQLSEDSEELGTLTAGQFISNGEAGDVTVQMAVDGNVVGEAVIHVVVPNTFKFDQESYTLPYGESVELAVTAQYNGMIVTLNDNDVELTLEPESMGTTNGLRYITCAMTDDAPTGGVITATLTCNPELSDTVDITLGRGSEIIFGFEDEDDDLSKFVVSVVRNDCVLNNIYTTCEIVDKEHGMVHDGDKALKITADFSEITWNGDSTGFFYINVKYTGDEIIDVTGAERLGAWMYFPEEDEHTLVRFYYESLPAAANGNRNFVFQANHNMEGYQYDEGHWYYMSSQPLAGLNATQVMVPQEDAGHCLFAIVLRPNATPSAEELGLKNLNNKLVFYLDSYSVDWSSVTPDRDMPIMDTVTTSPTNDAHVTVPRGEVYDFGELETVSFQAAVSDYAADNATGIDESSAKAYIDGVEIGATVIAGQLTTEEVKVAAGVHTLLLSISDGAGNTTTATRQFKVNANTEAATLTVAPSPMNHYDEFGRLPITSVYWLDVKSNDISKIQSASMDLDLYNNSRWNLDKFMDVNPKFDCQWSIEETENIATLTFTRTDDWEEGDSNILATLPICTWGTHFNDKYAKIDDANVPTYPWSYEEIWTLGLFFPVAVRLEVDRGEITYVEGYEPGVLNSFGSENINADTELFAVKPADVKKAYPDKTHWHYHTADTVTIEDSKEATCTENGYTGRLICAECLSPLTDVTLAGVSQGITETWGELVPATGHTYGFVGDILQCVNENGGELCGHLFNGVYEEDGRTYVDGVALPDGWVDNSYYDDGVLFTGVHEIDGLYYDFGEDGVCPDRAPITGFFAYEGDAYYALAGVVQTGWITIGDDRYHTGENGVLHNAEDGVAAPSTMKDLRGCATTGRIQYTCEECGEITQTEVLFFEGHDWDENHVCRKCGYVGRNIAEATLEIEGLYYKYTGGAIRAGYTVTYRGTTLNIRSDAYGYDGGAVYYDNKEIGVGTLEIQGRGNYYGTITGTFTIVPGSIEDLTCTETAHGSLELRWGKILGADYYSIYRQNERGGWDLVADTKDTAYTFTGLELGESYNYRVASRAVRDGVTYYCVRWAYAEGTVEHTWSEPEEGSCDPTCTEDGRLIHTCTLCGETETITFPPTGHNVEEWEVTQKATSAKEGSQHGTCTNCGEDIVESIPKLPHSGISGNSSSNSGTPETDPPETGDPETDTNPPKTNNGTTTVGVTANVTASDDTVSATVDSDHMTQAVDAAVAEATERGTSPVVAVEVETTADADSLNVTLPTDSLEKLAQAEDASLVIISEVAEVALDNTALDALVEQATGSTVVLEVTPVDSDELTAVQQEAVGEAPVVDLSMVSDGVVIHNYNNGVITVTLPYTLKDGQNAADVRVYYLDDNGALTPCRTTYADGKVTFTTTHLSKYVIASTALLSQALSFTDVPADSYYAEAVAWAVANDVTEGTSDTTFSPDDVCTRAQIVTLLWRANGSPKVTSANRFADVDPNGYYADAVAWAVANGVIKGTSDTTFDPDAPCTRAHAVTMLYRINGSSVSGGSTFSDVPADAYYADAVAWAVANGVTKGTGGTTFSPDAVCTRAQIVTLLYRALAR